MMLKIGKLQLVFLNLLKMINKQNFKKKLSITQGRHLRIINNKIQLFPEKNWKSELKLFNHTKLNFIEWVISKDNFDKNPLCQIHGYKIIKKYLKKNKVKCRSVDLDFIVKENPLEFSEQETTKFLEKISTISSNCSKIGVKYLIFPFLENSSPKGKPMLDKLILLFNKIKNKISNKIFVLIETDLNPVTLLKLIKKMKK